jgi:uncharacterized membrane protein YciS (DUF1049 family)
MLTETPNTLVYLVAGYIVFWLVTFVFVISLVTRTRNLEKDIEVLKTLMEEEQTDQAEKARQSAEPQAAYRPLAPDRR